MNKVWKNGLSLVLGFSLMSSLSFSFSTVDQAQLLKENDKNATVFELQRALGELGYFKSTDFTNLYGKQTVEAVKAFQRSQQMTADGVSGKTTLKAIRDHQLNQRRVATLKEGSSGNRALMLIADLKELGYLKGSFTGNKLDAVSIKALKAFQTKAGLKADGQAGDGTMEALTKAIEAKRGYAGSTSQAQAAPKETPKATTKAAAKETPKVSTQATPKATPTVSAQAAPAKTATPKTTVSRGSDAVRISKDFLGIAYRYGGSSSKGFDCSGFTVYIMKQYGIKLPHSATAQYAYGKAVDKSQLKEGDLLFFKTTDQPIGHVGIYIGDGQFIHASSAKAKVIISSLKTYGGKYVGARRVL